jgi:hypothetical protein
MILNVFFMFGNRSHSFSIHKQEIFFILYDHGDIVFESDNNDEEMPPVEDARYDDIKYLVEGESNMIRLVLNVQVNENNLEQ